jgi:hypothetical protein
MRNIGVGILILLSLTACFKTIDTPDQTLSPGAVHTAAAQTVIARSGASALATPEPTLTPLVQASFTPEPTLATEATAELAVTPGTPTVSPTPTEMPCDHLSFVLDVNYPDGTEVTPGERFKKIWRLENTGSCPWTPGYTLVFDEGDAMGGPIAISFTEEVIEPGETVDVGVDLIAPDTPGTYKGYWKLRNPTGQTFGSGEDMEPFWVEIQVVDETGIRFDFNAYADEAEWGSGRAPFDIGELDLTPVSFGPPVNPVDPFVELRPDQRLEDSTQADWVLITSPAAGEGFSLMGIFPAYLVQADDELSGAVGLLSNLDGTCGSGNVSLQLYYRDARAGSEGSQGLLWEKTETCDGTIQEFQINLSGLSGREVQFLVAVIANTNSEENWVFWKDFVVSQ